MRILSSMLLVLSLAGCGASIGGGGAFSASFPDNRVADVRAVLAQARPSTSAPASEIVAALSADGQHLLGVEVATGSVRYRVDSTSNVPVLVAGSLVLVEQGESLRVLDLATGRQLERVPLGSGSDTFHLIGAHADGPLAAVGLTAGDGPTARSRLLVLRNGELLRDVALDRAVGAPAVVGETLFVPWGYQFLSMLDAGGNERARIRLRSGVVTHALAQNGAVWFGGATLHRLADDTVSETPAGYAPPDLGIERSPSLLPSTYETPAPLSSAAYHVRLVFGTDPTRADAGPADDTLYLVYYRFVFALSATDAHPLWVRDLPSDVVGASAFVGGMRAACESGEIITLAAADGRIVTSGSVGERLAQVAFPRLGRIPLPESVESVRPDVRAQLVAAVQVSDARLVTAREFALSRIAAVRDDEATADLGLLCEDARLPSRTRQRACDLLATRSVGEGYVLTQLGRHGSFLDERAHPPVAALARAAASMRTAEAIPLLLEQLEDPRTPVNGLGAIAEALVALDARNAAPQLLSFLRLYHVEASEEGMTEALADIALAYARLGDENAIETLLGLAGEPLVPGPVARALRGAADQVRTERRSPAVPTSAPTTPSSSTGTVAAPQPTHITHELAEPVLSPVRATLTRCLALDESHPGSARVVLVLTRAGTVSSVHVTPQSVEPCIREALLPLAFPATQGQGPARFTFTVSSR